MNESMNPCTTGIVGRKEGASYSDGSGVIDGVPTTGVSVVPTTVCPSHGKKNKNRPSLVAMSTMPMPEGAK